MAHAHADLLAVDDWEAVPQPTAPDGPAGDAGRDAEAVADDAEHGTASDDAREAQA